MTAVYNYILDTGTIIPDTADIQTQVQTEYTNAFGTALNVTSPSTPQGLLINAETQARIAVAINNAALANQINPNLAGGISLDAILGLMGSQRTPASASQVLCTVTGVAGTIIPVGALVADVNGNQWSCLNSVTIPLSGSLSNVTFDAVETGPIVVTATQVNMIISNVLGWERVSNPGANTIVGQNTQTDVSARQYRINTLYLQSNGLAGSIISALTATISVNSLQFLENPTSSSTSVQGVTMAANSIYCCIDGTNQQAIAAALTATKSAGCAYSNGASRTNISYVYSVPVSGQSITVLWDNPDIINIGVQITVILNTPVQDYVNTIVNAILNYADGLVDGIAGLTVGKAVSPFEISGAVVSQFPGVYITNCEISNLTDVTNIGTLTSSSMDVTGLSSTANLFVGMIVSDGGVNIPTQTTIASIVSGTAITISQNATGSGTETLTFYGLPQSATISSSSANVTGLTDAETLLYVGMAVSDGGVYIPAGTTIAAITSNTTITLSKNATGSTTEILTFSGTYQPAIINIAPWQLAQIVGTNITVSLA